MTEIITIAKKHPLLAPMHYVIQAVPKTSDSAYDLAVVLIDKDRFVSTDGHVLLAVDVDHNYTPGLYRVVKNMKTKVILQIKTSELSNFPDYKRILSLGENRAEINLLQYSSNFPEEGYVKVIRTLPKNYIAFRYWQMVAPYVDRFSVDNANPDRMLVMFSNSIEASPRYQGGIMPIMAVL